MHGELNDMQLSGEIQRILDLEMITKYTFLQLRIEIPCLYNKLKPEKKILTQRGACFFLL